MKVGLTHASEARPAMAVTMSLNCVFACGWLRVGVCCCERVVVRLKTHTAAASVIAAPAAAVWWKSLLERL